MDVIVVGAGLSGLAAARGLTRAGAGVVVLEARTRVGGRTEDELLADGTPLELGGQWIGDGHSRMHELVDELGLATFRTYNDEGELLLDLQGKRSRMASHKGVRAALGRVLDPRRAAVVAAFGGELQILRVIRLAPATTLGGGGRLVTSSGCD